MTDRRTELIQDACNALREKLPESHVMIAVYENGFINYSHTLEEGRSIVPWLRAMADLIEKAESGRTVTVEDALAVERSTK